MLEFKCSHCGASIAVEEGARSRPVTCLSCNTRQRVAENAVQIPDVAVLVKAAAQEQAAKRLNAPRYRLAVILAYAVIVGGVVEFVLALVLGVMTDSSLLMVWCIGGVMTGGFGALMLCVRDIAINTWHIRHENK